MTNFVTLGCNSGIYNDNPGADFSSVVTTNPTLGTRGYRDNVIINPTQVPTAFADISGVRPLMSLRPHPDYYLSSGSHYNDLWNGSAVGPQIVTAITNYIQDGCTRFGALGLKPLLSTWHEAGNLYTDPNKLDSNGTAFTSYLTASKVRSTHVAMQNQVNSVNSTNVGHEVRYGPIMYFNGSGGTKSLSNMENWFPTAAFPMDWYGVDTYDNADQDLSTLTKIQNYLGPWLTFVTGLVASPTVMIPECNSPTEANRPNFFKNLANWLSTHGVGSPAMYTFYKCGGNSGGCWLPSDTATIAALNFIQNNYGSPTGSGGGGGDPGAVGNSNIALDTVNMRTGAGCMALTSIAAGDMTASSCDVSVVKTQGLPCTPGQQINLSAWFKAATTPRQVQVGARFCDYNGTFVANVFNTTTNVTDNTSAYSFVDGAVTAPAGGFYAIGVVKVVGTGAANEVHYVDDVQFGGTPMNNPAQNGRDFVGSNDMRGLANNVFALLEPPILVAGAQGNVQAITGGGGLNNPTLSLDAVYVDTVGGMGAVPGYPNWYLVTVPGFYDIDAVINGAQSGTSGVYWQGWIAVARAAAQAVAAGTGTPLTVAQYICPIGETKRVHSGTQNASASPSARIYLGVGDMVSISAEVSAGMSTGTGNGGSVLSMIWRGWASVDDGCDINANINNGGSVTQPTRTTTGTIVYQNTATYSYYGFVAPTSIAQTRRNSNGNLYQGAAKGLLSTTGSQYGQVAFPFAQMITDLTGKTITAASITVPNLHSWYGSGMNTYIGTCFDTPGGSKWVPKNNSKNTNSIVKQRVPEDLITTVDIPTSIITDFVANGCKAIWIGTDATSDLNDYGYFQGGANNWQLNVQFH